MPVVSKGDRFVFAQVLGDVVEFLGLDDDTGPKLTAPELAERLDGIVATAARLVRQMPDARLEDQLPNRPRSWRVLMHHVFQVPNCFLDTELDGTHYSYENLALAPGPEHESTAAIAAFGEAVHGRVKAWRAATAGDDFGARLDTYFGPTTRLELLERTTWHCAQHVRQLTDLLRRAGVEPDRPLTPAQMADLPLTRTVWDET